MTVATTPITTGGDINKATGDISKATDDIAVSILLLPCVGVSVVASPAVTQYQTLSRGKRAQFETLKARLSTYDCRLYGDVVQVKSRVYKCNGKQRI